jgi:hypothetical protein
MRRALIGLATLAVAAVPALANDTVDGAIYGTTLTQNPGNGYIVSIPCGASDYFNDVYTLTAGTGNNEGVSSGFAITSISVSVADFGGGYQYPVVGAYNSNLALDSTGGTPDLSSAIASTNPVLTAPASLFDFVEWNLANAGIPGGSTRVHGVVQFDPNDTAGQLGVGGSYTAGKTGFTVDGYGTPAITWSGVETGINLGQANTTTSSCGQAARLPHGRLRVNNNTDVGAGDHLTTTVKGGDQLQLSFWGSKSGDKFKLYYAVSNCAPAIGIGPVLPTLANPDGGTYLRINTVWPSGFGGATFYFSAIWGNPACSNPGVGFTNCVTVITGADPLFGKVDDGTIEWGLAVHSIGGASDYFNNDLADATAHPAADYDDLVIGVLDFVTTTSADFPQAGVSPFLGADPSGHTPDIANAVYVIAPYTWPAGAFQSTSGLYTVHTGVPSGNPGLHTNAWFQFQPNALNVWCGGDSTTPQGKSSWTLDGYATNANVWSPYNFAIRVQ